MFTYREIFIVNEILLKLIYDLYIQVYNNRIRRKQIKINKSEHQHII
jgi:hypothetical protein